MEVGFNVLRGGGQFSCNIISPVQGISVSPLSFSDFLQLAAVLEEKARSSESRSLSTRAFVRTYMYDVNMCVCMLLCFVGRDGVFFLCSYCTDKKKIVCVHQLSRYLRFGG